MPTTAVGASRPRERHPPGARRSEVSRLGSEGGRQQHGPRCRQVRGASPGARRPSSRPAYGGHSEVTGGFVNWARLAPKLRVVPDDLGGVGACLIACEVAADDARCLIRSTSRPAARSRTRCGCRPVPSQHMPLRPGAGHRVDPRTIPGVVQFGRCDAKGPHHPALALWIATTFTSDIETRWRGSRVGTTSWRSSP
jgi:hypothetical protein